MSEGENERMWKRGKERGREWKSERESEIARERAKERGREWKSKRENDRRKSKIARIAQVSFLQYLIIEWKYWLVAFAVC